MPKVKNPNTGEIETFPYTPKGEAMAEDYAESTGQEVIPTYDAGGRSESYAYGGLIGGNLGPSNLVANGEMTQDEVDKYIKPQLMKKGGKVKK